jgi:hypothetical protein
MWAFICARLKIYYISCFALKMEILKVGKDFDERSTLKCHVVL